MAKVVHFEIHATRPEALAEFYASVFGWQIQKWGDVPYWLITAGPEEERGINGAILQRQGPPPEAGAPVSAFMCTVEVDDLDATMATAIERGGRQALPRMAITGIGWVAYAADPDGNIFGMLQSDPAAA